MFDYDGADLRAPALSIRVAPKDSRDDASNYHEADNEWRVEDHAHILRAR